MKRFNINLPDEVYEKFRKNAFDSHTSMSELIVNNLKLNSKGNIVKDTEYIKEKPIKVVGLETPKSDTLCKHGKEKTFCTVSNCPNYASWK